MHRPAEQLYHLPTDRYELNNVAGDAKHAAIKKALSNALDEWLASQGDPGAAQDTFKAIQAARQGKHLYGPTQAD